ncbi:potassium/sodium hyperpolarization-activated cyclic nucleotide-gated channel 2-like [Asterias rubens]|uniref:potassium/sodium hyperpolarization-activated cyclic nucleotide-gated channel 2-like n=1 Tax=Asterias rubens TaxID=7604 RepID=UPI0014555C3F|nr:potassium/sodium hyperpolarization-activated cyclic nucleotide-gated channel 2-like [Asterias rubens]
MDPGTSNNPPPLSVALRSNKVTPVDYASPKEHKSNVPAMATEGMDVLYAQGPEASSKRIPSMVEKPQPGASTSHQGGSRSSTDKGSSKGVSHVAFDMKNVEMLMDHAKPKHDSKDSIRESMSLLGIPKPPGNSDETGLKNTFIRRQLWTMLQPTDNRLSMKLFGSTNGIKKEMKRLKAAGFLIVHPCSAFKFYWDLLMVMLLICNLVSLPVIIAFFYHTEPSRLWTIFNCGSDSLFILDVIINMRSGYMDPNTSEQVILKPKKIAIHYLKTWFIIDFISSIPMDCIFMAVNGGSSGNHLYEVSKALRVLRLAKLLSLVRLLRLSRLMRFVRQWEQVFDVAGAVIRIGNLICIMLLIGHWNGCLQFLVPMLQEFPQDSWVSINNLVDAHWWEQYTWALFKAMSHMLCIGYGRFPPQSLTDLWLTMASMISGASCFALFIGHATNLIQSMDSSSRQYREKLKQVEEYMAYRRLPSEMRERITDYYDYRYHGKMFTESVIFDEISVKLREDVANYNCRELVACVPFFSVADPNFVSRVVILLKFEVFQPGDYIIREGTYGDRMFFIQQGVVDVITSDGEVATSLSDGSYFGEICLLTHEKRVASIRTDTYCSLYSLSVEHFQQVLTEFPSVRKTMIEVAIKRLEKIGRPSSALVSALSGQNSSKSKSTERLFEIPDSVTIVRETENEKRHEEFEHDSMEEILQVNEGPSADTTQNQSFPIGGDSLGNNASYRHPSPV